MEIYHKIEVLVKEDENKAYGVTDLMTSSEATQIDRFLSLFDCAAKRRSENATRAAVTDAGYDSDGSVALVCVPVRKG